MAKKKSRPLRIGLTWETLPLSKKEATDILATLREWLEVGIYGYVEDLDNNKAGLTEERYNALVRRLERFTRKEDDDG